MIADVIAAAVIAAVCLALLAGQYALGRFGAPGWTSIILPLILISAIVYVTVTGNMRSVQDWIMAVLVIFVPLMVWTRGHDTFQKKINEETGKIDNTRNTPTSARGRKGGGPEFDDTARA